MMENMAVTEQDILRQLHLIDPVHWGQALDFLEYLAQKSLVPSKSERKVLTAQALLESDLVGLWADRQDIGDSLEFARQLRYQAETRGHNL